VGIVGDVQAREIPAEYVTKSPEGTDAVLVNVGGAPMLHDLPLNEVIREQYDRGLIDLVVPEKPRRRRPKPTDGTSPDGTSSGGEGTGDGSSLDGEDPDGEGQGGEGTGDAGTGEGPEAQPQV
jgi:hypothetical protein